MRTTHTLLLTFHHAVQCSLLVFFTNLSFTAQCRLLYRGCSCWLSNMQLSIAVCGQWKVLMNQSLQTTFGIAGPTFKKKHTQLQDACGGDATMTWLSSPTQSSTQSTQIRVLYRRGDPWDSPITSFPPMNMLVTPPTWLIPGIYTEGEIPEIPSLTSFPSLKI